MKLKYFPFPALCGLLLAMFFMAAFLSPGLQGTQGETSTLKAILYERLSLMPSVARYKWDHDLPVEDLAREAEILEQTVKQASAKGVNPTYATVAIRAQMAAAKLIQSRLMEQWRSNPDSANAVAQKDLVTEIRPEISIMTNLLIGQLLLLQKSSISCQDAVSLMHPPDTADIEADVWQIATADVLPPNFSCR